MQRPTKKTSHGVEKELNNSADYSSFVNYGHRVVNQNGETVGWVKGQFILEKAVNKVDKQLVRNSRKKLRG